MSKKRRIPIIDLFAGPGGLGEGFSSYQKEKEQVFNIKLSIEKDVNAHRTLLFRSFFRQFKNKSVPKEYYDCFRADSAEDREKKVEAVFNSFPEEYNKAKEEALRATLGVDSPELIDIKIKSALKGEKDWLLIGGPPCQAYSMVGRSRVGGVRKEDHRVYLYREYLRIIAVHQPKVFVMENVKGLLSARVGSEYVFNWMLNDLSNPSDIIEGVDQCPRYRVYSLSTRPNQKDLMGNPVYNTYADYLIKSENYGIPQKRHRVILLGIREDVDQEPDLLVEKRDKVTLEEVLGDLPMIRSRISKSLNHPKESNRYRKIQDSPEVWNNCVKTYHKEISEYQGMKMVSKVVSLGNLKLSTGAEYVPYNKKPKVLSDWYYDPKIKGVANHMSRSHLMEDLRRYLFASLFLKVKGTSPKMVDFEEHAQDLLPQHKSAKTGNFVDRFKVQKPDEPASTITSHISKDGHYFIHYDSTQCRSLTVREAARIQTFPDNYLFRGPRTAQYHQVGNAVPPLLAQQIAHIVLKLF